MHLVLMQDRANVSADFLELMKQEIIEVIKNIDVDESAIDVHLPIKVTRWYNWCTSLYANIPIVGIKDESRKINVAKKRNQSFTKR
ncbi:MAG: cell division topological specificity factor MinE [Clostridia bacterium]